VAVESGDDSNDRKKENPAKDIPHGDQEGIFHKINRSMRL